LRFLGDRLGWEHVMLGTDYPWDMSTDRPLEDLREAGLDEEALGKVARDNALAFLRMPAAPPVSSGSGS
jgi:aminocarboxymuconate-semialdehyde decarboxylase